MRALIREYGGVQEVYPENEWTKWTIDHLDWEIEINGWELVDPYVPEA